MLLAIVAALTQMYGRAQAEKSIRQHSNGRPWRIPHCACNGIGEIADDQPDCCVTDAALAATVFWRIRAIHRTRRIDFASMEEKRNAVFYFSNVSFTIRVMRATHQAFTILAGKQKKKLWCFGEWRTDGRANRQRLSLSFDL